jgi:hypothetical protein
VGVLVDITDPAPVALALANADVQKFVGENPVRKTIYVAARGMLNIVV